MEKETIFNSIPDLFYDKPKRNNYRVLDEAIYHFYEGINITESERKKIMKLKDEISKFLNNFRI
jgi:Zn-dependent oligopeptidase